MSFILYNDDCLNAMRRMEDNSVDSIVTDPPYGLSFMGKKWDYDVPGVDVWAECLRVLKPGGHLLAFAGTRTQHRMAVRIEDAGFEIRDMIAWVYGSGFPKSLDVSKAIDRAGGNPLAWRAFSEAYAAAVQASTVKHSDIDRVLGIKSSSCYWARTDHRGGMPPRHHWKAVRELLGLSADFERLYDEAEREVVGQKTAGIANPDDRDRHTIGGSAAVVVDITAPATPAAQQWQGWGTALKPALEPITVARKPLVGTVAANVLEHGTGAINVDGCRIGETVETWPKSRSYHADRGPKPRAAHGTGDGETISTGEAPAGRWPANLIHDGSNEVVGLFPESNSVTRNPTGKQLYAGNSLNATITQDTTTRGFSDKGSAARFFYCAKASKHDRDEGLEGFEAKATAFGNQAQAELKRGNLDHDDGKSGMNKVKMRQNSHPTVKPTDLMRYLCRLVTPLGGVVLDPFMGSGSTGKAAILEGFQFIGCEMSPEYMEIAKARIEAAIPKDLFA
jgi:DNA modification methylase